MLNMDRLKEILYLSRIIQSRLKNATKSDFERICEVSEKNHGFREWLNLLIEEGLIIIDNGLTPNKGKCMKKIKSSSEGEILRFIFYRDYEGWY